MMDEMINAGIEQEVQEKQEDLDLQGLVAGIQQEMEVFRGEVAALKGPVKIVGLELGQSGDFVPMTDEMAFEAKLRRAREVGDTMAALRIKQEAAAAGVVLF